MDRAFRVTVTGKGCLVRVDGGDGIQPLGFITTRFVVAPSAGSATTVAMRMLRDELRYLLSNPADQPCELEVEEVREDPDGYRQFGVGAGFTWYPDDEE